MLFDLVIVESVVLVNFVRKLRIEKVVVVGVLPEWIDHSKLIEEPLCNAVYLSFGR